MTDREWDAFWEWFFEARTRCTAFALACITAFVGIIHFFSYYVISGEDDQIYNQAGYEIGKTVHDAVWNWKLLAIYGIIVAAFFLIPLVNSGILGLRGLAHKWQESNSRKLRRETKKRELAEAKSAKMEAELEALDKQVRDLVGS